MLVAVASVLMATVLVTVMLVALLVIIVLTLELANIILMVILGVVLASTDAPDTLGVVDTVEGRRTLGSRLRCARLSDQA